MTKILLVEDDNNLREIYQARLAAEGYDIVTAEDGEAALALASKERPQLVITDVMMPKISGFEMLDILRNTDALHDVKVIMLTALSQAEDNARAGKLGADRYLVKSQVTLEDIVKAAHDLLDGAPADAAVAEVTASAPVVATPAVDPSTTDLAAPASTDTDTPTDDTTASDPSVITVVPPDAPDPEAAEAELTNAQTSSQEESALKNQINQFLTDTEEKPQVAEDSSLVSATPTDESDDEYAKDDTTPDMGNLSVQKADDAPVEAPAAPTMELPAPVEPQANGDQVVSSAIDSMMAQGPAGTVASTVASASPMGDPEATAEPDPSDLPASTPRPIIPPEQPNAPAEAPVPDAQTTRIPKKVITPLNHSDRTDIHQLLSLEEAKNGAVQAAQATSGPELHLSA